MKNGTRSNNLTLVQDSDDVAEPAVEPWKYSQADEDESRRRPSACGPKPVVLFFIVSAACAAAAIAAGSYALWLTRNQATHSALIDVQDLLQVCQNRMVQMESDLNQLP